MKILYTQSQLVNILGTISEVIYWQQTDNLILEKKAYFPGTRKPDYQNFLYSSHICLKTTDSEFSEMDFFNH